MKFKNFSGKTQTPKAQISKSIQLPHFNYGSDSLGFLWRLGLGVRDFSSVRQLLGLVVLTCTQVHAQRPPPHIGYVYPGGGQQGTTFTISVGGQTLAGASAAYFSGPGVQARVLDYDRPFTQKEINDLRERLQQLQDRRTAARAGPTAPAFTPDDETALEETRAKLAARGSRPTNPALAETLTLEVTLTPDAATGSRELRVKSATGISNPVAFCVGPLPESTDPVVTATANPIRPNAAAGNRSPVQKALKKTITLPAL